MGETKTQKTRRRFLAGLLSLAMLAGLMAGLPMAASAAAGNLTGTISIDLDASSGLLTANTGSLSGQSGGATNLRYKWQVTGADAADFAVANTFDATTAKGKVITLSVQDVGTEEGDTPSVLGSTATITVYQVTVIPTGAVSGDEVRGGGYFASGTSVTLVYDLSAGGTASNKLTFSGPITNEYTTASGTPVTGQNAAAFTVNGTAGAGYADGTYTVGAEFTHPNKTVTTTSFSAETHTVAYDPNNLQNAGLQANVSGGDADNGDIAYSVTAGSDVVSVAADTGALTIIKEGNATITATYTATATNAGSSDSYALTVNKGDISGAHVTFPDETYTYTGSDIEPVVTVKMGATTLAKGTDYTVTYQDNVDPGTATVVLAGAGNYGGTKNATFEIGKSNTFPGSVTVAGDVEVGKTLTATISSELTDVTYKWEMGGATVSTASTYLVNDAGSAITLTVTVGANDPKYKAGLTDTATTTVVPYKIEVDNIGNVNGDTVVTAAPESGGVGDEVVLGYVLGDGPDDDSVVNMLNIKFGESETATVVLTTGTSHNYTINADDAVNGVITITATFYHDGSFVLQDSPDGTLSPAVSSAGTYEATRINAPRSLFVELWDVTNNELVDPQYYTISEGSTIIEFTPTWISLLLAQKDMTHRYEARFNVDGVAGYVAADDAAISFNVVVSRPAPPPAQSEAAQVTAVTTPAPQTGDGSSIVLWVVLLALACAGGVTLVLLRKRIFAAQEK